MTRRVTWRGICGVLAACCLSGGTLWAQAAAPPLVVDRTLQTKDGVQLGITFYEGTKTKETVPVILLHDENGSRADMASLATYLQAQGHSVLVPDLRGHGISTTKTGADRPLQANRLVPEDYVAMAGPDGDLEACKAFLKEKNNEAELNIDKLCVVGAGMGANVGMFWAALDWSWPPLAVGKQGQDVKALVLISPRFVFKSLNLGMVIPMEAIEQKVSFYIAVGKGDRTYQQDAKRIYDMIKRKRPDPATQADMTMFFDDSYDTKLQGTNLLNQNGQLLEGRINAFIKVRLVDRPYPWSMRVNPYQ